MEAGEGTVVPTSGSIDKIYFNTTLGNDEMFQILSSLEYDESGIAVLTTDGNPINFEQPEPGCQTIIVMRDDVMYVILSLGALLTGNLNDMYYTVNKIPFQDDYNVPFLGWNPTFNGEVDIISPLVENVSINGIVTPSGSQNDKLTKLMSSAPFSIKEKELQKGTVVPNEGTVEKIYFNKNTSLEEVRTMLSQLTYTADDDDHSYIMACNDDETITIAAMLDGAFIADIVTLRKVFDGELPETEFANAIYWIDNNEEVNTLGFVGWNPNFSGEVQITGTLKRYMETGYENGAENKLLTPIISATPFKTVNRPVPNNTYVEKVYFNTKLTTEEIEPLLAAIWENEFEGRDQDSGYTLFKNEDGSIHYAVSPVGMSGIGDANAVVDIFTKMMNGEIGEDEAMGLLIEAMIWWPDGSMLGWETNWNPNFNGVIEVNSNLVDTHSENEWPYGGFNDQLVNLLSIDPYVEAEGDVELEGTYDGRAISVTENGELNLRSLITKEKKIPLKINVDVSQSLNTVIKGLSFNCVAKEDLPEGQFVELSPSYKSMQLNENKNSNKYGASICFLENNKTAILSVYNSTLYCYIGECDKTQTNYTLLKTESLGVSCYATKCLHLGNNHILVVYTYTSSNYVKILKYDEENNTITTLNTTQITTTNGNYLSDILDIGSNNFAVLSANSTSGTIMLLFNINEDYSAIKTLSSIVLNDKYTPQNYAQNLSILNKNEKLYAFYVSSSTTEQSTAYLSIVNYSDISNATIENTYSIGSVQIGSRFLLNEDGDFICASNYSADLRINVFRLNDDAFTNVSTVVYDNTANGWYTQSGVECIYLGSNIFMSIATVSYSSSYYHLIAVSYVSYDKIITYYTKSISR